jgi:hypothetical protein
VYSCSLQQIGAVLWAQQHDSAGMAAISYSPGNLQSTATVDTTAYTQLLLRLQQLAWKKAADMGTTPYSSLLMLRRRKLALQGAVAVVTTTACF